MQGVSCRMVMLILDGLSKPIPLAELIDGLTLTKKNLLDQRAQIPWEDFVTLMERMTKHIGTPEDLRAFGASLYDTESFRAFWVLGRTLLSPQDVYYFGSRLFGPQLFPMMRVETFEPSEGLSIQRLTLKADHRDCPALFHLIHGALEAGPVHFGFAPSRVEAAIEECRVTYKIYPASSRRSWLGRIVRTLQAPFTMPKVINELIDQQVVIETNYTEIRSAHDQIEEQAKDLERVNVIGQSLSQEIKLEQLTGILVRILLEELDADGVELWLIPPGTGFLPKSRLQPAISLNEQSASDSSHAAQPAPRLYRRGGNQDGAPASQYSLTTAARPVGLLKIWGAQSETEEADHHPQQRMLTRLIPWISMSLDNARSYEALQHHASELEQRVQERTARLLSANHHLANEISERKKASEALLQSEAHRRAAERLASIGTLAAGIAHEINNPIGAILAAAQFALLTHEEQQGDEENVSLENGEMVRTLQDIICQAKRCGGIVQSVLQFSRDEQTEKWRCNLPESIQRGVRFADRLANERGTLIETALPQTPIWGEANPIQIEQAVVNLVLNAVEASANKIRVEATVHTKTEQILIEITDDGLGITESERHRIFEPFYTTKRKNGGTGLGLSVVHGIVEEHRGRLEIDTNKEGGTRARLWLPLKRNLTDSVSTDNSQDKRSANALNPSC